MYWRQQAVNIMFGNQRLLVKFTYMYVQSDHNLLDHYPCLASIHINEEKVICYELELGNNLPMFRLNVPFVIRAWWQLVMTGAFSQNVGKLFSELKLLTITFSSFVQKPTEKPLTKDKWNSKYSLYAIDMIILVIGASYLCTCAYTEVVTNTQRQTHLFCSPTTRAGHLSTMPAMITTRNLCSSWEMQEQTQMQGTLWGNTFCYRLLSACSPSPAPQSLTTCTCILQKRSCCVSKVFGYYSYVTILARQILWMQDWKRRWYLSNFY